jgi:hypothetical protein
MNPTVEPGLSAEQAILKLLAKAGAPREMRSASLLKPGGRGTNPRTSG